MKKLYASALLLAAITSASAAVVNISWTGGGWTFSGTLDIGANTGLIDESTPGLSGTMSATDGSNNAFIGQPIAIDISNSAFSFTVAGNVATKTAASIWFLDNDGTGNNLLSGTVGQADWPR